MGIELRSKIFDDFVIQAGENNYRWPEALTHTYLSFYRFSFHSVNFEVHSDLLR